VAAACLAVPRGAPVLLAWPGYADDWFTRLAAALAERGARPLVRRYDEALLTLALRQGGVAGAAAVAIPPPGAVAGARLAVVQEPTFGGATLGAPVRARIEQAAWRNLGAWLRAGRRVALCAWPRPGDRQVAGGRLDGALVRDCFVRALDIDYGALRRRNARLRARLQGARRLHLGGAHGTDLELRVGGRPWLSDEGRLAPLRGRPRLIDERYFQLPGGEVYVAVHERSANGRVCFRRDGDAYEVRVVRGLATAIAGGLPEARARLARHLGIGTEPVGEVGVGTNPGATPLPIGILDEKCLGTAHVALGANARFGGRCRSRRHCDIVITEPDLEVDGVPLLRRGVLLGDTSAPSVIRSHPAP
jgi:leucyl aminopeptidase (aminopeptidase T)